MNHEITRRLQRAATEIESSARSRSRHPSQLARHMTGTGLNWPFSHSDLLHVLHRNGLEVKLRSEP